MGARDGGSGSPCCCSLCLRRRVSGPCARWSAAVGQRRGTGRARGRAGRDRDQLRSAVPRLDRAGVAGLVCAPARPVAVQPQAARAGGVDRERAAAACSLAGQRRSAPQRRHLDRGRQLSRLCSAERVAGFVRYGYAKSQHRYLYGVRLVLLTDTRGLPLGYTIVPASEKEYEPLADLLTGTPAEVVVADKGLWGRGYRKRLAASGTALLTPRQDTHRRQPPP
ncbi:MAG TPA: transposase [Gaiellaceae bacterium]|nr:transposase [Gaiellaceae bacterium]